MLLTLKEVDNPLFTPLRFLCNLLVRNYKGVSMGGGVIQAKGLMGTQGVQTKAASLGWVHNRSSVWVLQLTTKILSVVKCKCPHNVAIRPSKKS